MPAKLSMVVTVAGSSVPLTFTSVELSIFMNVQWFFKPTLWLNYEIVSGWWNLDTLLCWTSLWIYLVFYFQFGSVQFYFKNL